MDAYQQSLDYLYSFVSYEQKAKWDYNNKTLNLERFKQFLHLLGNPQYSIRTIHVAGSDGKGSVCTMLAYVLREMGYKVGQYLSPHLLDIRERIQVDGEWISAQAFVYWTNFLKNQVELVSPLPEGYATFFELMTAMAFLHFQQQKVDFAVIETGLGGRLDATNVMNPEICIITHISKEHTAQLGDTLPKIADEKLGIVHANVPVIIGSQDIDLLPHFKSRLASHTAPVTYVDQTYSVQCHAVSESGRTLSIQSRGGKPDRTLELALAGQYQMQNALTAVAALDCLEQENRIEVLEESVLRRGFKKVQWPGRFELWRSPGKPVTVFDVSHTTKGAMALRSALDELFPNQRRCFVFGVLKGKSVREMTKALARQGDDWFLTQAPTPRAQSIEEIEQSVSNVFPSTMIKGRILDPLQAYQIAQSLAAPDDVIVVTGSLYLVGDIQKRLQALMLTY